MGHHTQATARKNRVIYLLRFIAVASGGYKTDFNCDSVSSISSVKNSPADAIKILAVILNLFYCIYFQKSEFTLSAFRYHENSDHEDSDPENSDPETHIPGNNKEKRFKTNSSQSYHPNCFMVTQFSQVAAARKNRDIYLLRFIAVASGGYKN